MCVTSMNISRANHEVLEAVHHAGISIRHLLATFACSLIAREAHRNDARLGAGVQDLPVTVNHNLHDRACFPEDGPARQIGSEGACVAHLKHTELPLGFPQENKPALHSAHKSIAYD